MITGATGFLGSHLLDKLATREEKIVVLARTSATRRSFEGAAITWLEADLTQPIELDSELEDVDSVIHLAGKTFSETRSEAEYYYSNELATFNLLEKIALTSRNFIYSSSQWVYGNPNSLDVSEKFPLIPAINGYACSKINAENWIQRYQEIFGGKFVSLRFSGFIQGGGLVDYVIEQAIKNAPIQLYSQGNIIRDYISIDDGTDALIKALDAPLKEGFYPINIGSGAKISALEIANLVVRTINSTSEIQGLDIEGKIGNFVMKTSSAQKQLNFQAQDLQQEIQKYAKQCLTSRGRDIKYV